MSELVPSWLVFDYGGVIGRWTSALPALAERLGGPLPEVEAAYWANRDAYDKGDLDDLGFWRAIADKAGVPLDEPTAADLTELDIAGWLESVPDTVELLAELATAGTPLALLSNAPSSFGRVAEREGWTKYFAHLVFSGDFGLIKPAAPIWRVLTDRLGVPAGECLFFDDKQVNVEGATENGLRAARWTGARDARALLVGLGVLTS
ncbi:MAG TPA: HAD-IA family hydrolase [Pseudonocardiaceae bacterium]|nr:HAD-IA family hydrolase [Pseudonocardiaceae bacterium]